jgi:hypothetical protein
MMKIRCVLLDNAAVLERLIGFFFLFRRALRAAVLLLLLLLIAVLP